MLAECETETDVTEYQNVFARISEDGNEEKAKENIFVSSFFTTDCRKSTNTLCKCRELNESSDCASWIILHESTRPFHWISGFYRIRAQRARARERRNRFSASVSAHFVCSANFGILIRAQVVAIIAHIRSFFSARSGIRIANSQFRTDASNGLFDLFKLKFRMESGRRSSLRFKCAYMSCFERLRTCKFCVKCLRCELELIRPRIRLLTQPNILNVNITFAPKSFSKRYLRHSCSCPSLLLSCGIRFWIHSVIFAFSLCHRESTCWRRRVPLERPLCSFLSCAPSRVKLYEFLMMIFTICWNWFELMKKHFERFAHIKVNKQRHHR